MIFYILITCMCNFSLLAMKESQDERDLRFQRLQVLTDNARRFLIYDLEETINTLKRNVATLKEQLSNTHSQIKIFKSNQEEFFKIINPLYHRAVNNRDGETALKLLSLFEPHYAFYFNNDLTRNDILWLLFYASEHSRLNVFCNESSNKWLTCFFYDYHFPGIQNENPEEIFIEWCAIYLLKDLEKICQEYNFEHNLQFLINMGYIKPLF